MTGACFCFTSAMALSGAPQKNGLSILAKQVLYLHHLESADVVVAKGHFDVDRKDPCWGFACSSQQTTSRSNCLNTRRLIRRNIHKPNKRNLSTLRPRPPRDFLPSFKPPEARLFHNAQAARIRVLDHSAQHLRHIVIAPGSVHRKLINPCLGAGPRQAPPRVHKGPEELGAVAAPPVLRPDHVSDLGPAQLRAGPEDAPEADQLARRRQADPRVVRVRVPRRQERV
ncbi:hypothetical protein NUW58_g9515 [Xylaria curta]|uniref:Uncharacterized protein n=1 Tax=Xylaria curta TaxID=42375 RepID=A0ACC1MWP8_9PEZI|nr:hypothetical protein NUW58_g9515 [Xylaria curta]